MSSPAIPRLILRGHYGRRSVSQAYLSFHGTYVAHVVSGYDLFVIQQNCWYSHKQEHANANRSYHPGYHRFDQPLTVDSATSVNRDSLPGLGKQ